MEGHIDLQALKAVLLQSTRPDSIVIWLYSDHVRQAISDLSTGELALDHQSFDRRNRRYIDHLAGLCEQANLLPARDYYLARFDQWVELKFPETPSPYDRRLLRQFAQWNQRRGIAEAAMQGRSRASLVTNRCQEIKVAANLINWLNETTGKPIGDLSQRDLEAWWAAPPTTNRRARPFINWLIRSQQVGDVGMPKARTGERSVMSDEQRVTHLCRCLDPEVGLLSVRVAAMLLLLLAQPFQAIASVRIEGVAVSSVGDVSVVFGKDPLIIPPPFAGLVEELRSNRSGLQTATNPTSPWLFPGARSNGHLGEATLRGQVRALGIDLLGARISALRELVRQCPPALVADMIGCGYATAERYSVDTGQRWSRYVGARSTLHVNTNTTDRI